ncbi:hypothetical protein [Schaalia turicensis]|uniref:hypothetical protein n=1 Tax=Schaalia turicensis TaxID=131111 RepID=UPI000B2FAD50|nr:hypothetical protein [Schaalia turicensis]
MTIGAVITGFFEMNVSFPVRHDPNAWKYNSLFALIPGVFNALILNWVSYKR